MRLASHLGMSLGKCKEETLSEELEQWMMYLDKLELDSWDTVTKQDWYLARIAMEIQRTLNPKKTLSLEKFLLKFKKSTSKSKTTKTAYTREEYEKKREEATAISKAFWFSLTGYKPTKKA